MIPRLLPEERGGAGTRVALGDEMDDAGEEVMVSEEAVEVEVAVLGEERDNRALALAPVRSLQAHEA